MVGSFSANTSLQYHLGIPAEEKTVFAIVEEVSARRLRAQILPEKFLLKSPGPRNYFGFSAHKKTVFVVKEEMGPRCLLAQILPKKCPL